MHTVEPVLDNERANWQDNTTRSHFGNRLVPRAVGTRRSGPSHLHTYIHDSLSGSYNYQNVTRMLLRTNTLK